MRYLILDRTKLSLYGISLLADLIDLDMVSEEESLAKFKRIVSLGIDLGMTVGRLTDEDLEEVIKEL